jgi:hypothetical protein
MSDKQVVRVSNIHADLSTNGVAIELGAEAVTVHVRHPDRETPYKMRFDAAGLSMEGEQCITAIGLRDLLALANRAELAIEGNMVW